MQDIIMIKRQTSMKLTRNQQLVHEALLKAEGPMSAYALLDVLRADGFRAPPQIYRALEKLIIAGKIHRLESINAFVACNQPGCGEGSGPAFTICDKCGGVDEITDGKIAKQLQVLAGETGFSIKKSSVEIVGTCTSCLD